MGETLDIFITVVSLVVGGMLLTGHGDFFMKGGNADLRKKLYDEEKLQRASGIGLLCYGAVTGINMLFQGFTASIIYFVVILVISAVLIWYIRTRCRK